MNSNVVRVASDGTCYAVAAGSCTVRAVSNEGGRSSACSVTVTNGAGTRTPVTTTTTSSTAVIGTAYDPTFMYNTTLSIIQAKPKATVEVNGTIPMAYDKNVAAALKIRPDVTLKAVFPFQNHQFAMILPAGYDLQSNIGANGYADWLTLCALQPSVTVQMLK